LDRFKQIVIKFAHALLSGRLFDAISKIRFNISKVNSIFDTSRINDFYEENNFEEYDDEKILSSLKHSDYFEIIRTEELLLRGGLYQIALKVHYYLLEILSEKKKKSFYRKCYDLESSNTFYLYRQSIYRHLISGYHRVFHNNFSSKVYKKKVVIIGPLVDINNIDIESFDTIIRFNDISSINLKSDNKIKSHITYFNSEALLTIMAGKDDFELDQNADTHIVIKNYLKGASKFLEKNHYRMSYSNPYFLNGSPNLLQMATWDILHFDPEEIWVLGVDFFLSKNKYPASYYSSNSKLRISYQNFIDSMAIHNLISNRRFIGSLYRSDLLQLDEITERVLNLSDQEYLDQIFAK
jgi:hypothetical protein